MRAFLYVCTHRVGEGPPEGGLKLRAPGVVVDAVTAAACVHVCPRARIVSYLPTPNENEEKADRKAEGRGGSAIGPGEQVALCSCCMLGWGSIQMAPVIEIDRDGLWAAPTQRNMWRSALAELKIRRRPSSARQNAGRRSSGLQLAN